MKKYPFVRIIIPFSAGILLSEAGGVDIVLPVYFLAILLLPIYVMAAKPSRFITYKTYVLFGLMVNMQLFVMGYYIVQNADETKRGNHFSKIINEESYLYGKINGDANPGKKSVRIVVNITAVSDSNTIAPSSGKALIYLLDSVSGSEIHHGDRIVFNGNAVVPSNRGNPYEFDYKEYLAGKNIHHQFFLREGSYVIVEDSYFSLGRFLSGLRDTMLGMLRMKGMNEKELSVAGALVLGYKDLLEKETKQSFAGAGAMHILCVSGLHVGILYVMIGIFLRPLRKRKWGKLPASFLLLLAIWCYAGIAGFAPSVIRSSTMFSFITLGNAFKGKTNIYNSLAASAFFLILLDPYVIMKPGFQLSYAAVFSIVSLQPALQRLWIPKSVILRKTWTLLTVSIAAQAGTAPISLFYFHIFPNYFFITNLFVIPLSAIVLYLAVFFMLSFNFDFIADIALFMLEWSIRILNLIVEEIESLPGSVTESIWLSNNQALLLMVLLLFIVALVFGAGRGVKFLVITVLLLFSIDRGIYNFRIHKNESLIVYNIRKSSIIQLIHHNKSICFFDKKNAPDLNTKEYMLGPPNMRYGIGRNDIYYKALRDTIPFDFPGVICRKEYILTCIKESPVLMPLQRWWKYEVSMPADHILILSAFTMFPDSIPAIVKPGLIVADGTIYGKKLKRLKAMCLKNNINIHAVTEEGAFVLKQ